MNAVEVLSETRLFAGLTREALTALAARAALFEIRGGSVLYRHGDAADAVYVVGSGRLRAIFPSGQPAGDIGRAEAFGEVDLLAIEHRATTVFAVRDSLLLKITREVLAELIQQYPQALLDATRVIIQRLRVHHGTRRLEAVRAQRAIALIPLVPRPSLKALAQDMAEELGRYGTVRVLDIATVDAALGAGAAQARFEDGAANERLVTWLNAQEAEFRYLIYCAGDDADAWARRCMRQADEILVCAPVQTRPLATAMVDELRQSGSRAAIRLLLLRAESEGPGEVDSWREQTGAEAHFYLRPQHAGDAASLARSLTGRGVGLVLGGGGARGFAHIGLLRAMAELKIPVDVAGGSSMGAFFAALVGAGYSHHEILHIARETFVTHNYLNDYLFPSVALLRGRKFVGRLKDIFGERQIEHLRTPFFCISSNLTRGTEMVHDRGPLAIWLAASMAVPGVAPPIVYKGELLVDGALVNSLPTDVMQRLQRGPILASDVSTAGGLQAPGIEGPDPEGLFKWKALGKRPGLFNIMFRTATITSETQVAARAQRADVYLRMPVSGIALFDWKKLDEVCQRGYEHALQQLGEQRDKLLQPTAAGDG